MRREYHGLVVTVVLLVAVSSSAAAAEPSPDFTKDVAPLLTKYCTGCHSDADRAGKLSLESYAALRKGGAKGSILTPGAGEASRIMMLLTGKAQPQMPPEDEEQPTAAEVALLTAWIDAGAKGPDGKAIDPAAALVTPRVKLLAPARPVVNAVAMSPQGNVVALARYGEVELQSLPERKTLHLLAGCRGNVNAVAFSDDGRLVAAAAGEPGLIGEARVWKVADGSLQKVFAGHKDSLYAVRLSPDGSILATGSYDSQIKLWDTASGKELRTLDGHNGAVFELAFRRDGKVLASASGDRTVKLWDVATGTRLDTLKESLKELYALAFRPDGKRLAAAGVDNRIRIWEITPSAKEGTNLLLVSKFAHESPILRLSWSPDGKTLVSAGEDRLIKVWDADTVANRATLEPQSDWATGLAIGRDSRTLAVGRIDGTTGLYKLAAAADVADEPLDRLPEVPAMNAYGEQPAVDQLAKVSEAEPNDTPAQATAISAPGSATGRIFGGDRNLPGDHDLFRFHAEAGDQFMIETNAARSGSPLDSKIEVLDAAGQNVPRLLLRAVRDTVIEFRGMTSEQRGVRLANYQEMLLNEYVYLSGEVIKHFQQRRGPDADGQFYPEAGNRFAFFETTSRSHALGEPGYMVVPYAIGTELPNNGLPVFTLNYENDDQSQRKFGKDSQLTFIAPTTGDYLVRVSDVRGFAADNFKYELILRRPQPDFQVKLSGANPTVNAESGKTFNVKAERTDNFHGPIRIDITGVPPGFRVTTPIIIAEGLYEAQGVLNALPSAPETTKENWGQTKVTATATVCGKEVTKDVNNLGTIKRGGLPKVIVHLEPSAQQSPAAAPLTANSPTASSPADAPIPEVTIAPGGSITCKLRVERKDFKTRIGFDVGNLPHGVIVDDIGLSGVLIPEGQTERTIFLTAEPWVPEQSRLFHATAQVDGNQVSLPMWLHVRKAASLVGK